MKNTLVKLSYDILKIANSEQPRSVFLKEISNLLRDYFQCADLRFLLKIPKNESQFELIHCTKDVFDYKRLDAKDLSLYTQEEESLSLWDSILNKTFDSNSSFFTDKGTFWTINFGNISASYRMQLGSIANINPSTSSDYSLLIVPFLYSNERIGLIQCKEIKPEIFSKLGTEAFEEFSQALSAILINQYTQALLLERVKELNFLYAMSNMTKQRSNSLEDVILQIIELIPPALQYPEITQARITLNDTVYVSEPIGKCEHTLVSDILIDNVKCGTIEVIYTEKCPKIDEGPFFHEERNLLNNIAAELTTIISQKNNEKII